MLKFRMGIVLLFGILAMAALSSGCWMMVPVAAGGHRAEDVLPGGADDARGHGQQEG